jgi:hypothetical protein
VRERVDAARLRAFLTELGRAARVEASCYLTGGTTAVMYGWRDTTRDIDLRLEPEDDALLRRVVELKNELRTNVELADPGQFIPLPSGWRERSVFVVREGTLSIFHFDPYAQALAKVERDHPQDRTDVRAMISRGLVDPGTLGQLFHEVESQLHRFPGIDAPTFRRRVERVIASSGESA